MAEIKRRAIQFAPDNFQPASRGWKPRERQRERVRVELAARRSTMEKKERERGRRNGSPLGSRGPRTKKFHLKITRERAGERLEPGTAKRVHSKRGEKRRRRSGRGSASSERSRTDG